MTRNAVLSYGRNRLVLDRDVRLIEVSEGHLWLEGLIRLRPGQSVDLVGNWPGLSDGGRARVVSWSIVRLTGEGPYYRGACRLEA
jgi:hypothetical protein